MSFSFKQKLQHYSAVADGSKSAKKESKFSQLEQRAYARGQRDARNESRRAFAFKNASSEQRDAYKAQRKAAREAYKASKKD